MRESELNMTSKMVALCLLRVLPRGGSNFRVWLTRAISRTAFALHTSKLRRVRECLQICNDLLLPGWKGLDKPLRELTCTPSYAVQWRLKPTTLGFY